MLRNKKILLTILLFLLLIFLPNMVKAKDLVVAEETTKTSTGIDAKWKYALDSNNEIVELLCSNKTEITGNLTIPEKIDGYVLRKLGPFNYSEGTFENCYGLTGITFSSNITEIGNRAFYNCTGLKKVIVPNNIKKIGDYAFHNCKGIQEVNFGEGVTTIGGNAFSDCTGLKTLTIPDNVTSVGAGAFEKCSGILNLTLSKNMTIINAQTFHQCTGLTSVKLPENITTINGEYSWYGAFSECSNLKKILIPDTVVSILKGAFSDCRNLTIYGNDGQASKQYADENKIKFDYIENWDKQDTGVDITAPTVKSIYFDYSNVMNYWNKTTNDYRIPKGVELRLTVEFTETLIGTEIPTLTIKCGNGKNIELKNGEISADKIIYHYKIQKGDEGLISVVDLAGGNISDNSGNTAKLSIKEIKVQYQGKYAYANGGTENIDNSSNDNKKDTSSDKYSDNKKDNSDNLANNKKDSTIAPGSIPYTGGATFIIIALVGITAVGIYLYKRNNDFKGI